MSDPPRLMDTASEEAALLEAWSSMRAPSGSRAKALALAGLGAGAGVVGASAAAKSGAGVVGSTAASATGGAVATAGATGAGVVAAKWIAAIGLVAAIGGGTVVASTKTSAPSVPTVRVVETNVPAKPAEVPLAASAAPATPVVAAADLPNVEAPPPPVHSTSIGRSAAKAPEPVARASVAAPEPEPAPVASTLGAEVTALDAARNALRSGDPARSLRELDAFDANHPSSALAEDAALLRFDANVALGDRAGADKAARTFLARYPSSPRATKVRRYLDGAN